MSKLANNLIHKGYLKTDVIIEAFSEIDRAEFVPDKFRAAAVSDIPMAIGHGQVLPEPSVLAFMLELLRPAQAQSVLVVGFGGGWVTTLMSYIVGSGGNVLSIDTIQALKDETQENITKYNFITRDNIAQLRIVENCTDLSQEQKFDRIIVINPALWSLCTFRDFLAVNGVMVAPIDNVIYYFYNRKADEEIMEERFESMHFLPA